MEEELNEHDLEERLYAMLHHVDETQINVIEKTQNTVQFLENAAKSTVRRYWRTSADINQKPTLKEPSPANKTAAGSNAKPKEEKTSSPSPPSPVDLSIFQCPPQNVKSTIEIIEHDVGNQVVLESSDEDEVIEVALPPKPTITIESSDEDELQIIKPNSPAKNQVRPTAGERCVSASPVPSVVSSVSDEFIRGDCIALNISSRHPDNHSFDFSLHGADLLDQNTPSKKKRRKKTKEAVTSTPVALTQNKSFADECFATPKIKAKNKKKKSFTISEKSIPSADIYDSDSNQSIIDTNKNINSYVVTEKSLPSVDVYESDSSHSGTVKEKQTKHNNDIYSSDSSVSLDKPIESTPKNSKNNDNRSQINETFETTVVDLTKNDNFITLDNTGICENIVMGNVTGFAESEDYGDENAPQNDISKFVSTKIPSILYEDLDFDNLKGKDKVCKKQRYSLTSLRSEMEKFYNESWGGENFNHREIQKNMSRDKSLWTIDPKDRMPSLAKRKMTCNYCNRTGHRDDTCRMKPPICHMCGVTGHFEPRCPSKICVNCGSPNHSYSTMCRNCCTWNSITCAECGQNGHPSSHCPDLWRRYHNTIDNNAHLERNSQMKKHHQIFCSGCTRRGHFIHTCRNTVPFSGLPINSPYVRLYRPIYSPSPNQNTQIYAYGNNQKNNKQLQNRSSQDDVVPSALTPVRAERHKRQSKSPTVHESHVNKKRISMSEEVDARGNTKSPVNTGHQRKTPQSNDESNKTKKDINKNTNIDSTRNQIGNSDKTPNFIPVSSTNYDKKGHIIQDNEVSDTSDAVTSARIYVTNEIIEQLKTNESENWLKETMEKHNVDVQCTDINAFLSIKGKVGDQEAFQSELREWMMKNKQNNDTLNIINELNVSKETTNDKSSFSLIPKNRNNLLRHLSKALNSLKEEIGDPKVLYKELTYFQNRHEQLLKQKVISPEQLSKNRCHINVNMKKLNMVLLGQAGLADGSQHLSELYSFQEKLMNSRQKNIPPELRKEIGQHYYSIFTAIPRNDYLELLKKFYHSNFKNKNGKSVKQNAKLYRLKNKANSIPVQQIHNHQIIEKDHIDRENDANKHDPPLRQKLVFYHQRLLKARPNGAILKKARVDLVRKLHSMIASMFTKDKLSSKTKKKMRKAQEQAQMFLTNV